MLYVEVMALIGACLCLFTSYALQKGLRRLWLMHCWLHGHVCEHAYYGFILDKAHKTNLDASPKSDPALEIISRAAPSVEAHHRSVGPDAGKIPEEDG